MVHSTRKDDGQATYREQMLWGRHWEVGREEINVRSVSTTVVFSVSYCVGPGGGRREDDLSRVVNGFLRNSRKMDDVSVELLFLKRETELGFQRVKRKRKRDTK